MRLIDNDLLDGLSQEAANLSRLRKNFNFHENLDDHVQRLLNALEPGTQVPIHRHKGTDEIYILLRGKLKVLLYNDYKELIRELELDPLNGKFGVEIKAGEWHSIEVVEPNTVIFEVKQGPYMPISEEDTLT